MAKKIIVVVESGGFSTFSTEFSTKPADLPVEFSGNGGIRDAAWAV